MIFFSVELKELIKLLLVISFFLVISALIPRIDVIFDKDSFFTELNQAILLLCIIIRLFYIGKIDKSIYRATILMACFFSVLLIRELDALFDKISHGAWFYFAIVVTIFGILKSSFPSTETNIQLKKILYSHAGIIIIVAMPILLVFSRIYGMNIFWEDVMGENYMRTVKTISEESIELCAYYIIAIGVFKLPYGNTRKA